MKTGLAIVLVSGTLLGVSAASQPVLAKSKAASPATAVMTPRDSSRDAPRYFYFRDSSSAIGKPSLLDVRSLGSFTPSALETRGSPLRAPDAGGRPLLSGLTRPSSAETGFRFTPSGKVNDPKAFAVGVTSRVISRQGDANELGNRASGYNVGVALGYWGFSVEAGMSKMDERGAETKGVDLGLSYRTRDWKTSLQVAGQRQDRDNGAASLLAAEKAYSVDVGGAYLLTPKLSVTGGVRYSILYPPAQASSASDRDSQSASQVYLGTEVQF